MSNDEFWNMCIGCLSTIGLIYYTPQAYDSLLKTYSSVKAKQTLEELDQKPKTVSELLKSRDLKNLNGKFVYLRDVAEHVITQKRKEMGVKNTPGHESLDLWSKTTSFSHGFKLNHNYEESSFYLGGKDSIFVEIDNELVTPVINPHVSIPDEEINYFYYPLFMMGLTNITSYNIEYLSSGDMLNVWGILEYSIENNSFSLTDPSVAFIGSLSDAITGLTDKIMDNAKELAFYGLATATWGAFLYLSWKKFISRHSLTIEDAEVLKKWKTWGQKNPSILRRPCLHIAECNTCYPLNGPNQGARKKFCPVCLEESTSVHEIK